MRLNQIVFARVSVDNWFFPSLLLLFSSSYSTGRPRIFTNHVVCAAPKSEVSNEVAKYRSQTVYIWALRSNRSINGDSFFRQQESAAVSEEIYLTDRSLKKKKRKVDGFFSHFRDENNFAISVLRHMIIISKYLIIETRFITLCIVYACYITRLFGQNSRLSSIES